MESKAVLDMGGGGGGAVPSDKSNDEAGKTAGILKFVTCLLLQTLALLQ